MWRSFKEELSVESDSRVLSAHEHILSEVVPRKQSVATIKSVAKVAEGNGKQNIPKQSNLVENSRTDINGLKAKNLGRELKKTVAQRRNNTMVTVKGLMIAIQAASIFDFNAKINRNTVELPSTDGIEYTRVAAWTNESLSNVLKDEKGRQLFRVFLHEALAEENLSFIESYEKFKKMSSSTDKKRYIEEFFEKYSPYVNLSSVALQKIKETAEKDDPDPAAFSLAVKEVNRLLENDQFPRFKRSNVYINFLEKVMPRSYAEKWKISFEALIGNQVGRHHFRRFLQNIHAEENLRFWEAVVEYKQLKNRSPAMLNMSKSIQKQYLIEGTANEVFLPFGLRQIIERKIEQQDVDNTLFDGAVKYVEQILKNDPYVRYLQSTDYNDLLSKLKS